MTLVFGLSCDPERNMQVPAERARLAQTNLTIYFMKILYFNHRHTTLSNYFTSYLDILMIKIQPDTIDWNELWKQARSDRSYKVKDADDWDKKAPAFARRNSVSRYIDQFIELLRPHPSWSVLDVG